MPECLHHESCGLTDEADPARGLCILHSRRLDKNPEVFANTLREHLEARRNQFTYMVFPQKANFTGISFPTGTTFAKVTFAAGADFTRAAFDGTPDFSEVTFAKKADFGGANFGVVLLFPSANFAAEANFTGAFFGMADFSKATFHDVTDFSEATFQDGANFSEATFAARIDFGRAKFGGLTDFKGAKFFERLNFMRAGFAAHAGFSGVSFSKSANIPSTAFDGDVDFSEATFEDRADFHGSMFAKGGYFGRATFTGNADFSRATFTGNADFFCTGFRAADFKETDFSAGASFHGTSFDTSAYFGRATFSGSVYFLTTFFSGRAFFNESRFRGRTLFTGRRITGEPDSPLFTGTAEVDFCDLVIESPESLSFRHVDFQTCHLLNTDLRKIELTGVHWPKKPARWRPKSARHVVYDEISPTRWKPYPWEELERLYRELKQNYDDRRNYPRAGDFHYGEKEMQRRNPATPWNLKFLLCLYWLVSGYGERFLRPLIWIMTLLVLGSGMYLWSGGLLPKSPGITVTPVTTGLFVLRVTPDRPSPLTITEGSDWLSAMNYSLRVMTLLRPDDLVPAGVGKGVYTLQSLLGPLFLGLFGLAVRQRLKH